MTGSRPLPARARREWALAHVAARDGLLQVADEHAGDAWVASGPHRYPLAMEQDGVQVRVNALLAPGWAFLARNGWRRQLLVTPAAPAFLTDTAGQDFVALVGELEAELADPAGGLVELAAALGRMLARAFDIPDDPGDLDQARDLLRP